MGSSNYHKQSSWKWCNHTKREAENCGLVFCPNLYMPLVAVADLVAQLLVPYARDAATHGLVHLTLTSFDYLCGGFTLTFATGCSGNPLSILLPRLWPPFVHLARGVWESITTNGPSPLW